MALLPTNRRPTSPKSKPSMAPNNSNSSSGSAGIGSSNTTTISDRTHWQKYALWGIMLCISLNIFMTLSFHSLLEEPLPQMMGQQLLSDQITTVKTKTIVDRQSIRRQDVVKSGDKEEDDAQPNYNDARNDPSQQSKFENSNHQQLNNPNNPSTSTAFPHYSFSKDQAEEALTLHGHSKLFQPLRAYIEKPLNDTVPDTVEPGNLDEKRPKMEVGRPGKFYVPLPLREGGPEEVRLFLFFNYSFCILIACLFVLCVNYFHVKLIFSYDGTFYFSINLNLFSYYPFFPCINTINSNN